MCTYTDFIFIQICEENDEIRDENVELTLENVIFFFYFFLAFLQTNNFSPSTLFYISLSIYIFSIYYILDTRKH